MKRPLVIATALAAATVLTLAGCSSSAKPPANSGTSGSGATSAPSSSGPSGGGGDPATGGTIQVLQKSDFSYLDPARGFDGGVNNFYRLVYRTLTTAAPGNAANPSVIVPDLATSLGKASSDGLTWTYTLKPGLKFDNGTPITSAEVKFGISRNWDPEIGIGSPYAKQVIKAPDGYEGPYKSGDMSTIETPDATTVVFHLKKPFPEFDAVLAQANMVPFPKGSGGGSEFINTIISSGPYKLESFTQGASIKLVRNTNWDPATDEVRTAKPDAWQFNIGIDGATIDERLIAGQGTDVNALSGTIQPATLPRIQSGPVAERVVRFPGICTTYMSINTTRKPFDDVRVRQAISFAVDRKAVLTATGGTLMAKLASTILPTTIAGHQDFDLYPSPDGAGDPEKAKSLLAEAGITGDLPFTLDIRAQPKMQSQAEAIQQSLAKAGIKVELNVIDVSTYYETIGTPSKQHDGAITGWCPDWASSASTFIPPLFDGRNITEKGNANLAQLNDPAINSRIDEISKMTNQEEANKAWGDLDKQILQLAPIVPLNVEQIVIIPGENVTGLYSQPGAAAGGVDYVLAGLKDPSKG